MSAVTRVNLRFALSQRIGVIWLAAKLLSVEASMTVARQPNMPTMRISWTILLKANRASSCMTAAAFWLT
jgi:hypothetical protein